MRFYLLDLNSLRWYLQRSNHWNWHWFYALQYWHKINAGCTLHFGFTHNIKFACLHRVTENVRENMCYERKSVMLSNTYVTRFWFARWFPYLKCWEDGLYCAKVSLPDSTCRLNVTLRQHAVEWSHPEQSNRTTSKQTRLLTLAAAIVR